MKIQKFTGENMKEALSKVSKEFGKDAVILQSRKVVEDGLLGFKSKSMVEVTAAIDKEAGQMPALPTHNNPPPIARHYQKQQAQPQPKSAGKEELRLAALGAQIEGLQETIKSMSASIQHPNTPALPDPLSIYFRRLAESGMDSNTAGQLLLDVYQNLGKGGLTNTDEIERNIKTLLSNQITKLEEKNHTGDRPFIVAVVGPTGVGKTTTLAKLAARAKLYNKQNVAFITADTFRIAASDQIRAFAEILKIPVEVVYSRAEMRKAVDIHADKDIIFIDTTGRSPGDSDNIADVMGIVKAARPDEVHLVLSSSTDRKSQNFAVNRFGRSNIDNLIFTKLDESMKPASILDVAVDSKKPIAFITDGQKVPEDIKRWDVNEFTTSLLKVK